uniref:hypothetical protein n=1 Tax=Streptococcus pluranimalium TaxID=82348 RepID=UPI003F68EF20
MKTLEEKAIWLNDNYGNYGIKWYLSDPGRCEAIYDREIAKRRFQNAQSLRMAQKKEQEERVNHVESVYFEFYHTSFREDVARDRRLANERLQAIRSQVF